MQLTKFVLSGRGGGEGERAAVEHAQVVFCFKCKSLLSPSKRDLLRRFRVQDLGFRAQGRFGDKAAIV